MSVLKAILNQAWRLSESNQRSLAVFDLDSTIFDLSPRTFEIVRSFAERPEHRAAFPEGCLKLANFSNHGKDWGLLEPLERLGVAPGEPMVRALGTFWKENFFANDFLRHDEPHKGAAEFVRKLHSTGCDIVYLSGRDKPNMLEGTVKSLQDNGFPLASPNVALVLKPFASIDDAQFKVEYLLEVAAQKRFSKIWLFENEPYNINQIAARIPEVEILFFDSCHSGREPVRVSAATISDFLLE